jgi:hypothetical protein
MKDGRPLVILVRDVKTIIPYEKPTYVCVPLSRRKMNGIFPAATGEAQSAMLKQQQRDVQMARKARERERYEVPVRRAWLRRDTPFLE